MLSNKNKISNIDKYSNKLNMIVHYLNNSLITVYIVHINKHFVIYDIYTFCCFNFLFILKIK